MNINSLAGGVWKVTGASYAADGEFSFLFILTLFN